MEQHKILAVIGNPVLHSKSPNMFNSAFAAMGIDASYMRLSAPSAEDAIATFRKLNMHGANVTAPYKEDVMPLLDWVDPVANLIGGVNTIVSENGTLKGYNTDHYGVAESVVQAGVALAGTKCIVVGAGGAGKAAAYGLISRGADVCIANRTLVKAETAAEALGCKACSLDDLEQLVPDAKLIVFSLSPDVNPIKAEWLTSEHVIFDANYKSSALGKAAREKQCQIIEGLDWLLNQAIPAFSYFFGIAPDVEAMKAGLSAQLLIDKKQAITMIGFMGAGKTSVGRKLAKRLERTFADTDNMIVDAQHRSIPDIFATDGEAFFRQLERETLLSAIAQYKERGCILSTGGGIIVNEENRKALKDNAVNIWLYASAETIVKRIQPGTRPLLNVENPVEKANELLAGRLAKYSAAADLIIDTDRKSEQEILDLLYEEISKAFGN